VFGERVDFSAHPRLDSIKRLCAPPPVPAAPKGYRRLVVAPLCSISRGLDQIEPAIAVLDAVDRKSTVDGQTLILWNDSQTPQCPPQLRGEAGKRIVWEYGSELGWCGINRGEGEAYVWALRHGYDAVLKLDAGDSAILRTGWDAHILHDLDPWEMRGHILFGRQHQWCGKDIHEDVGGFGKYFRQLDWCADWCRRGELHWENCQGGCYALGRKAIEHMDRTIGMPTDAEKDVGEDHAFTVRMLMLGLPVTKTPAVESHLSRDWDYSLSVSRWFRDRKGAAVVHPIRNPQVVRQLCAEEAL
jgi:hypothetical protein